MTPKLKVSDPALEPWVMRGLWIWEEMVMLCDLVGQAMVNLGSGAAGSSSGCHGVSRMKKHKRRGCAAQDGREGGVTWCTQHFCQGTQHRW